MNEEEYLLENHCHIEKVGAYLRAFIDELAYREDHHDLSKLEEPEKHGFMEILPSLRGTTYGSEEYKSILRQAKPAINHHYAFNRHHPEYFPEKFRGMNLLDLLEMIADWMAATGRHKDSNIIKSIDINQERFGYTDELKAILINTVKFLEEQSARNNTNGA